MLKVFNEDDHPYVQSAIAGLLVQRRKNNKEIVRMLVLHPNDKIRRLGKLYSRIKNDKAVAKDRLNHIFRPSIGWIVCDNMPFIHLMANSTEENIRLQLLTTIKSPKKTLELVEVREILKSIHSRLKESLKS